MKRTTGTVFMRVLSKKTPRSRRGDQRDWSDATRARRARPVYVRIAAALLVLVAAEILDRAPARRHRRQLRRQRLVSAGRVDHLAIDDGELAFEVLDLLDIHREVVARQNHQVGVLPCLDGALDLFLVA